ncbi:larval cuticle protein LCP-17-like [Choristoneura fumiferana]|uniref:Larvae cuticle protein n=1 Tax=Choristoneura fumiferana TaxID=7141 RepID=S4S7G1_CHOFU|nr:larvae cuticle protein [Choristoneura fumiferana]
MKFLVAFALAVAVASADVSHVVGHSADAVAQVLRSDADVKPDGFQYAYETSNGIAASAQGDIKDFNSDHASQSVAGQFRYTSPDGTPVEVSYVADENGFQPKGDHLPVAPQIPPQIARALEWIAAHPAPAENVAARVVQVAAPTYNKPAQSAFGKPYGRF